MRDRYWYTGTPTGVSPADIYQTKRVVFFFVFLFRWKLEKIKDVAATQDAASAVCPFCSVLVLLCMSLFSYEWLGRFFFFPRRSPVRV